MKRILSALFVVITYSSGFAQDTTKIVRVRERVVGPVYSGSQVKTFFNGFAAPENLPGILKDKDVVYKFEKSPDEKSLTVNINPKEESHPVLKYFINKSRLYYNNKFYPHNTIPSMSPTSVKEVVFIDSTTTKLSYLKVITN